MLCTFRPEGGDTCRCLEDVFGELFTSENDKNNVVVVNTNQTHHSAAGLPGETHTSTISTESPQCFCRMSSSRYWASGEGTFRESTMWSPKSTPRRGNPMSAFMPPRTSSLTMLSMEPSVSRFINFRILAL
ncbi:hypothetical protein EYF80_029345 [Liparis tanakae]|uniref:Uncharacterized protein n=1 Tax=Liparis tanakae TaxID=230148 RepID=A0A4Z2H6Q7_9TELE|nr:hypothetical protein EYF80_029345 [Liparis tanakae]